jgi:hypothetical protein
MVNILRRARPLRLFADGRLPPVRLVGARYVANLAVKTRGPMRATAAEAPARGKPLTLAEWRSRRTTGRGPHLPDARPHQGISFGKRHGVIGEIERAVISDLTRSSRQRSKRRASKRRAEADPLDARAGHSATE